MLKYTNYPSVLWAGNLFTHNCDRFDRLFHCIENSTHWQFRQSQFQHWSTQYQLRGIVSTLRMRTAIWPAQWLNAVAAMDSSAWHGPRREVSLAIIYPAVYCWGAIPCWCVLMRTRQLFNLAATSRVICVRYWLYRGIGNREFKTHVCAKRQTWICAAWPSFTLNCRLLFITSTRKKVVSRQFYP